MRPSLAIALLLASACVVSDARAGVDGALVAEAHGAKAAFVRDLELLVNLDSGTDDAAGLATVERFLVRTLDGLGAKVEVVQAPPAVGNMVIGRLQGAGQRDIMLMIHFDTVFGVGESTRRPFRINGNKAYGPGVADAKGGALIILHAVALARQRGWKNYRTLTIFFNPDEEKSSLGSREAIRKLAAEHDYVLSYEPPEADRVTVATNGVAYVHLDVKGRASHAGSAPEAGRNAAVELSHQILQLKDLGNPTKGTTVNWTILQAGERVNVIPETASATADMRMSDWAEIARVQGDANRIVKQALVPETVVSVRVEGRRPPFPRNPASEDLAALCNQIYQELGKTIEPVSMRYGTDAGFAYLPGSHKPAVLDGLGIVGDRIHSVDEWADLDSIVPRLYLTVRLLEQLTRD